MAYNKVGTPRFYINLLEWMAAKKNRYMAQAFGDNQYSLIFGDPGFGSSNFPDLFRTYPRITQAIDFFGIDLIQQTFEYSNYNLLDHGEGGNSFIAFLGHRFGAGSKLKYNLQAAYDITGMESTWDYSGWEWSSEEEVPGTILSEVTGRYYTPRLYSSDYLDSLSEFTFTYKGEILTLEIIQDIIGDVYVESGGDTSILKTDASTVPEPFYAEPTGNSSKIYLPVNNYKIHSTSTLPYGWWAPVNNTQAWMWLSEGVEFPVGWNDGAQDPPYSEFASTYYELFHNILFLKEDYPTLEDFNEALFNYTFPSGTSFSQFVEYINFGTFSFFNLPSSTLTDWAQNNGILESAFGLYPTIDEDDVHPFFLLRIQPPLNINPYPPNENWFHGHGAYENVENRSRARSMEEVELTELVNSADETPEYNGFSISTFNGIGIGKLDISAELLGNTSENTCQSVIVGSYYDMPHSPELSLTMSNEMDGVSRKKNMGGSEIIQYNYIKPRAWNERAAWELYKDVGFGAGFSTNIFPSDFSYFKEETGGWEISNSGTCDRPWEFVPNYSSSSAIKFNSNGLDSTCDQEIGSQNVLSSLQDYTQTYTMDVMPGSTIIIRFEIDNLISSNKLESIDLAVRHVASFVNSYNLKDYYIGDGVVQISHYNNSAFTGVDVAFVHTYDDNLEFNCWIKNFEVFVSLPENLASSKIGRRTWDLEFNYLSDTDIFAEQSSLTNYETTDSSGIPWEWVSQDIPVSENTLTQQSTFFSHVLHKTNGGQLPFIFQPDNKNFNPDSFAICKFDMKTFEFEQVANGVYNIKVKIREVW